MQKVSDIHQPQAVLSAKAYEEPWWHHESWRKISRDWCMSEILCAMMEGVCMGVGSGTSPLLDQLSGDDPPGRRQAGHPGLSPEPGFHADPPAVEGGIDPLLPPPHPLQPLQPLRSDLQSYTVSRASDPSSCSITLPPGSILARGISPVALGHVQADSVEP